MIRNLSIAAFTAAFLALTGPSAMAQEEGIPVAVEVKDATTDKIIPTAVVRHPMEAERHRVNTETGRWTEKVLYMSDGSELLFTKGMVLNFEVSAPGYSNASVAYVVRKRNNIIPVYLNKMELSLDDDLDSDPNIQFGRDKPLDK
jgi:hypothetical protein